MNEQNVITVKIGRQSREINIPRSWDDLDDRTALLFYNTLFSNTGDEYTNGVFTAVKLIGLTQHILGFTPEMMALWEASFAPLPPSMGDAERDGSNGDTDRDSPHEGGKGGEVAELLFLTELKQVVTTALGGLFDIVTTEEGGTAYSVKFNRTKNVWPVLSVSPPEAPLKGGQKGRKPKAKDQHPKTVWYYCAADGLANITLYELAYTFSMYEAFVRTKDEDFANKLIGALYRPSRPETREDRESDWFGDRRQPLRRYEGKVEERAKMAATLPALTRRFIVFWFAGCREAIAKQYPRVFKKGSGDGESRGAEWGKLLLSLAETGTFGALGETSDQHYSNALTYMTMKDEEAEKARMEMERMKRK